MSSMAWNIGLSKHLLLLVVIISTCTICSGPSAYVNFYICTLTELSQQLHEIGIIITFPITQMGKSRH